MYDCVLEETDLGSWNLWTHDLVSLPVYKISFLLCQQIVSHHFKSDLWRYNELTFNGIFLWGHIYKHNLCQKPQEM